MPSPDREILKVKIYSLWLPRTHLVLGLWVIRAKAALFSPDATFSCSGTNNCSSCSPYKESPPSVRVGRWACVLAYRRQLVILHVCCARQNKILLQPWLCTFFSYSLTATEMTIQRG
jgi:hypothetical protein